MDRVPFRDPVEGSGGSCMIVLATDAPLSVRNLERLAKRAALGLARTGSFLDNGSGDFVIAFSTASRVPYDPLQATRDETTLANDAMSPLFLATVEVVEEAVLNSLFRATTVTGRDGHTREAFPIEIVEEMIETREGIMAQEEHDKRIDYIELPTTDIAAAKAFYTGVFGWTTQDWGPDYSSFEDGRLNGGFRHRSRGGDRRSAGGSVRGGSRGRRGRGAQPRRDRRQGDLQLSRRSPLPFHRSQRQRTRRVVGQVGRSTTRF